MPELAEVEYFRKQWDSGLRRRVGRVHLHPQVRDFRSVDTDQLSKALQGGTLQSSQAHGKQMLFGFSGGYWLGVHLGMSGRLHHQPPVYVPDTHDHLALYTTKATLVFTDPRQFGRIRFDQGKTPPDWWQSQAPDLLSDAFTRDALKAFLQRRSKAPIKAVLLMQERFPGIGNWMADEILWRARILPATPAGAIQRQRLTKLYEMICEVCREALEVISSDYSDPPDSWLFNHRWRDNGACPQTGVTLIREEIGGRTTCWSPQWQR